MPFSNLSSIPAVSFATALAALAGIGVGDVTTLEERFELPTAIVIRDIEIIEDGSIIYDREVIVDQAYMVWSGQIFNSDGSPHCSGGAPNVYVRGEREIDANDVDWLVGDNCLEGLEMGMTFLFTWTSLTGEYADVHYPVNGLGVVLAIE